MNGRIYDPVLGQFMQPDNFIQTPEDYLDYDRYSYCRGNPFKFTDPSGEYVADAGTSPLMDQMLAEQERADAIMLDKIHSDMDAGQRGLDARMRDAEARRISGAGSGRGSFIGMLFKKIGKLFSGKKDNDGATPVANVDAGTGIRAMSDEAMDEMEAAFDNVGIQLNYTMNFDGTFTITGAEAIDGREVDEESLCRMNDMIDSGKSIDVRVVDTGGSLFIPMGNSDNNGTVYSNSAATVLIESGGSAIQHYDYNGTGGNYPNGIKPGFASMDESFIHEFLGHGYDYAMGDYSGQSISIGETNAILMTNHYREFINPNARLRTLYYNPRILDYEPLYFDGGWQGNWLSSKLRNWWYKDEIKKIKRP